MRLSVVIGGGPAGLTAAYELARHKLPAIVLEKDDVVGGISRTVEYKGYRFDIGGHRFFTKVQLIQDLWQEFLMDDLLLRPRLSRIFYKKKFFDYPLKPLNALTGLGPFETLRIGLSYIWAKMHPSPEERNFEQWVTNRFGRRLFKIFFETYTEKVWGMPCTEIGSDWAAQRIKNLDLAVAIKNALLGVGRKDEEIVTTLIDRFYYPRLGPGMMWESCQQRLADMGTETLLGAKVVRLGHRDGRITYADIAHDDGSKQRIEGKDFISSMPITELVRSLDPAPPPSVLEAARGLRYRDFLTVGLIVDRAEVFPDNWIYIHSPEVRMGRIQNFKNWSPEMVPDPSKTSLGLEYFANQGDDLWQMDDEALGELGLRECETLGLISADEVLDSTVIRMPKAYPVYDHDYGERIETLRRYLTGFENLQTIGRNGQHRYNNQDHSMLAGIYAARNVAGAQLDVWKVNVEREYHEEGSGQRPEIESSGDRLLPRKVASRSLQEFLDLAFARYDSFALGVAVGAVCAAALLFVTLVPLLRGDSSLGTTVSLLSYYLFGYEVSWRGLLVGIAEAGLGGFLAGVLLGKVINLLVGWHDVAFRRRVKARGLPDLMRRNLHDNL